MDHQLLLLINRDLTNPLLDYVMVLASSWDAWWPFLLIAAILVAIFGGFHGRAFLVTAALAIGLTDAIVVDTAKGLVKRPRPHEAVAEVRTLDLAKAKPRVMALTQPLREEYSSRGILPRVGNAFPSGHASNNFAIAAVCIVFFGRWGWLALLPAILVSYSRIYVGSHWPVDVLVSSFLGLGLGFLTCAITDWLWSRLGTRFAARWYQRHPSLLKA